MDTSYVLFMTLFSLSPKPSIISIWPKYPSRKCYFTADTATWVPMGLTHNSTLLFLENQKRQSLVCEAGLMDKIQIWCLHSISL